MSDEATQLHEAAIGDADISVMVDIVLRHHGCRTVAELFERHPDEAFELHDQVMMIIEDTSFVGEFEHDLEREVIRRGDP